METYVCSRDDTIAACIRNSNIVLDKARQDAITTTLSPVLHSNITNIIKSYLCQSINLEYTLHIRESKVEISGVNHIRFIEVDGTLNPYIMGISIVERDYSGSNREVYNLEKKEYKTEDKKENHEHKLTRYKVDIPADPLLVYVVRFQFPVRDSSLVWSVKCMTVGVCIGKERGRGDGVDKRNTIIEYRDVGKDNDILSFFNDEYYVGLIEQFIPGLIPGLSVPGADLLYQNPRKDGVIITIPQRLDDECRMTISNVGDITQYIELDEYSASVLNNIEVYLKFIGNETDRDVIDSKNIGHYEGREDKYVRLSTLPGGSRRYHLNINKSVMFRHCNIVLKFNFKDGGRHKCVMEFCVVKARVIYFNNSYRGVLHRYRMREFEEMVKGYFR